MADVRLDQFYTNDDVVQECLALVGLDDYDVIVEPSAGSGAFYVHLPAEKRVGVDLEPACEGVIEQDYFKFVDIAAACQMFPIEGKTYLVVGNPPFGKNSSLARKFFNASALFADTIAFVLPRTFRKPSTLNQLNEYFHLTKEIMLGNDAFHLPDGKTHDVPCVFQVWERYSRPRRKIPTVTDCKDFKFIEPGRNGVQAYTLKIKDKRTGAQTTKEGVAPEDYERYQTFRSIEVTVVKAIKAPSAADKAKQKRQANVCVRRVGAGAGQLYDDYQTEKRDWKSHYYIKTKNEAVAYTLSQIEWDDSSGKYDTAGNPSISKNDLIRNYYKTKESLRKELK
jgi:hypothetical protein